MGPAGRVDNAAVQQRRLQIETRRWVLSKLLPRTYGDKVVAELVGDADRWSTWRPKVRPSESKGLQG